jgi:hypothetical protein
MRIVDTLHSFEHSHGALIEVAEEEIADFEAMMMLIDSEGGSYALDGRLVSTTSRPEIEIFGDHRLPLRQHAFARPADIRRLKRYYEIRMNRN